MQSRNAQHDLADDVTASRRDSADSHSDRQINEKERINRTLRAQGNICLSWFEENADFTPIPLDYGQLGLRRVLPDKETDKDVDVRDLPAIKMFVKVQLQDNPITLASRSSRG